MRRITWLTTAAMVALTTTIVLLGGCDPTPQDTSTNVQVAPATLVDVGSIASEMVDSQTGCHYYVYNYHALTPRLDEFGRPMCSQTRD